MPCSSAMSRIRTGSPTSNRRASSSTAMQAYSVFAESFIEKCLMSNDECLKNDEARSSNDEDPPAQPSQNRLGEGDSPLFTPRTPQKGDSPRRFCRHSTFTP